MFGGKKIVLGSCQPFSLPPFPSLKLQFHTMKTNFFVNSLPLFVKTSRKFFLTKTKREWENEAKRSISFIQPTLTAVEALKWKKASTVSVTMKRIRKNEVDFCFWSVVAFLHVTRLFRSFHSFMVLWFWLKPFRALNYSENFLKKNSSCIRNYECSLKGVREKWQARVYLGRDGGENKN